MHKIFFSITILVTCGLMLFIPALVAGQTCTTIVPPGLVVNETWTAAGSPYCVQGDIQVSLLTIEPDVEVLVDGPYEIEVLSTITAVGTATSPILFSAKLPDPPDEQRWKGIKFQNTPPGSELSHVIIEYSDDSGITFLDAVPPALNHCVIQNNSTLGNGGGINADGVNGTLELLNCTFLENTANPSQSTGYYMGGALYIEAADAIIKNSQFIGNRSNSKCYGRWDGCDITARGGAIYIGGSAGEVMIENSDIRENQTDAISDDFCGFGRYARSYGGGVFVDGGTVTLANSTLSGNITKTHICTGPEDGSGLYVNGGSVTAVNSTIARNLDSTGVHLEGGTLDALNSIIYFNNNDGTQVGGAPTITYSDVQNGYTGVGNIDFNPVFSGLGHTANDLKIVLGSPAIDAGNPDSQYNDVCLPPSFGTVRNDMGAHGGPGACQWMIDSITYDKCISELGESSISVLVYPHAGSALTYKWEALNGGDIIGGDADVQFNPPDQGPHSFPYKIALTVTSTALGQSDTRVIDIYVKLAGDVDGNGVVNVVDKVEVRNHFGESGPPCWIDADADCNGVVNVIDKVIVRNQFGQTGFVCPALADCQGNATTIVPPGLVVNETWTAAGSPYCVQGDIQVSLLTIEPDVEVLVDGPYEIEVLSTITAVGTATSPILFSAKLPDPPDEQRWKGIKFQNTPPGSELSHVIIEYSDDSGITFLDAVPPALNHCVIQNNSTLGNGGGINADGVNGTLELLNCTFLENTANPSQSTGYYMGGALYIEAADAIIKNSQFIGNRSNSKCYGRWDGCDITARGGAIYIGGSAGEVMIENSDIRENQTDAISDDFCGFGRYARSYGAGVFVDGGNVTLANSTLSGNITKTHICTGPEDGSGLYVNGGSVTAVNSTIARNLDSTGVHLEGGTLDILNSIIYFNNNDGTQVGGAPTITYSDVQNGYTGVGNIDFNPVFSGLGYTANDLKIAPGSLSIDAGNPDSQYNDVCLPPSLGTEINDMGAHGGPGACQW